MINAVQLTPFYWVLSVPRTWSTTLSQGTNCLRNLYLLLWLALVSHSLTFLLYLSTYVQPKKMISKWKLTASQPACSFLINGELLQKIQCPLSLFGQLCIISTSRWRNRDKVSNVSWSHIVSQRQLVKYAFTLQLLFYIHSTALLESSDTKSFISVHGSQTRTRETQTPPSTKSEWNEFE